MGLLREFVIKNNLQPQLFVEPFAGGASVAIQLLQDNLVQRIGLIDRDPMVVAFWETVFWDTDWLLEQIETVSVTVEQWNEFRKQDCTNRRQMALQCLFLNRTSFSGILAAGSGPIGGQKQASKYKIDCRFPRSTIQTRVTKLGALRSRIAFVQETGWEYVTDLIERARNQNGWRNDEVFLYYDPPFYEQGHRLYRYYFLPQDHYRLRTHIINLQYPWVLSYDASSEVKAMYQDVGVRPYDVELLHSTKVGGNQRAKELVFTNLTNVPLKQADTDCSINTTRLPEFLALL